MDYQTRWQPGAATAGTRRPLALPASAAAVVALVWHGRDDEAAVHGIARPTRQPGHYSVQWDGLDDAGRPCPPGDYRIEVEAAREHGGRQRLTLPLRAPDGNTRHQPQPGDEIGALRAHRGDA
ncbi:DUF2271 domain-containing protein [Paracoccus sp. (in: a-proteobacteria)]|uniref:DUF2271 domain-containing protein n=1 Tax=Paracoccus sp. TaxID=267 RepID=UPI003A4C7024